MIVRGLLGLVNTILPGKGLKKGPFVTEEEIRQMADVAAEEAAIETSERELIHSIFEFGDTVVREVMVPRPDMIAVEADATVDEGIALAISAGKSRLPSFDDSTDNIVGLVFLKDLVARSAAGEGSEPVRGSLRSPHYVPESKRVAELLREMQTEKFHMAIVVDEYGGTAGLVTMEDLLEEIVGEITDEYDVEEPQVERLPDGTLRVPGRTPIDEVDELLDVELPQDEWDTVGGLVFNTLGHVPGRGRVRTPDRHRVLRGAGAGPPHRLGADPCARTARDAPPRTRPQRPSSGTALAADAVGVPFGVRVDDRPAERRQVDAREPARRAQGVDRLRPPADDAHADPRRPHDRVGTDRVPRHARACTSRARCSASARTTARPRRWPRST